MPKKPKFRPRVTRIKLNPEQAVLSCSCYGNGGAQMGLLAGVLAYLAVPPTHTAIICSGTKGVPLVRNCNSMPHFPQPPPTGYTAYFYFSTS